ncbi:MAG: hypothetical protein KDI74_06590 [Gammaproteobacteria bacterium]|nr:hypothetical protein [Gammaproteobacteria bacterium]
MLLCWSATAVEAIRDALHEERDAEIRGDDIALTNAQRNAKRAGEEKNILDMFCKDLGSFVRFYEFISQIVPFDDTDLEKLAVYAKHLRPLLRPDACQCQTLPVSAGHSHSIVNEPLLS